MGRSLAKTRVAAARATRTNATREKGLRTGGGQCASKLATLGPSDGETYRQDSAFAPWGGPIELRSRSIGNWHWRCREIRPSDLAPGAGLSNADQG